MAIGERLQSLLDLTDALEAALTRDDVAACRRLATERENALEGFLGELQVAPEAQRASLREPLEELLRRDEALRDRFNRALADLARQLEDLGGRSGAKHLAGDAPLCLDRKA